MIGEASQKAMTGANGTPMARSAAISGITPARAKRRQGANQGCGQDHHRLPPLEGAGDQIVGAARRGIGGDQDRGGKPRRHADRGLQREDDDSADFARIKRCDHGQYDDDRRQGRIELAKSLR